MNNNKSRVIRICALLFAVSLLGGCSKKSSEIDPFEYIELGQYKGLDIEKVSREVSDDDMMAELEMLASAYAEYEPVYTGVVQNGDILNIDYMGLIDDEAFDGGTASNQTLTIGSGTFIDGFESGLIGANIGDTVDLYLKFPDNYGAANIAGKDVHFIVTVNYATKSIVPEVTDEFINRISSGQFETLDDYNEALRNQIDGEYKEAEELQYYEDLWNAAVDNATVIKDIPNEIILDKTSRMVVNAREYARVSGLDYEKFLNDYMGVTKDEFNTQSADYARIAAKESLVLKAIATKENISVSQEELDKAIDEYVDFGKYESRDDFLAHNNVEDLKEYILTSKVQEFLAENAKK